MSERWMKKVSEKPRLGKLCKGLEQILCASGQGSNPQLQGPRAQTGSVHPEGPPEGPSSSTLQDPASNLLTSWQSVAGSGLTLPRSLLGRALKKQCETGLHMANPG